MLYPQIKLLALLAAAVSVAWADDVSYTFEFPRQEEEQIVALTFKTERPEGGTTLATCRYTIYTSLNADLVISPDSKPRLKYVPDSDTDRPVTIQYRHLRDFPTRFKIVNNRNQVGFDVVPTHHFPQYLRGERNPRWWMTTKFGSDTIKVTFTPDGEDEGLVSLRRVDGPRGAAAREMDDRIAAAEAARMDGVAPAA